MQGTGILSKRGFRRAAFCIPALALLAALTAMISAPAPCRADASLIIKTGNTWSVTGKDDLQQLKYLASGVGWEFAPTADTTAALKAVGIQTIRCINVEPSDGTYDKDGNFTLTQLNTRLQAHLDTCTTLGAVPHVIIGTSFPEALRLKPEDVPDQYKEEVRKGFFGPTDWVKFRNYYLALFEYIIITKGFANAEFEVANEPDINGGIYPAPPRPSSGARANYEAAFNLYKNIAQAAVAFEVKHPGMHVKLGGPAASWAFTFKFGDFNWIEHFIRDCAEQKLKLDFVGVHFYGNICSLDGQYDALYPPFTDMWRTTQNAIDTYYPGVPIQVTEWGPSYVTNTSEEAAVNANNVGVAWGADFLNTMLGCGVSKALYLVTTDYNQPANGKPVDVWGWPSLYVNPTVYNGKAYPKMMYHLFEMISRLQGHRVESTRGNENVNCFISADPDQKKVTLLVWNYGAVIPEEGPARDKSVAEKTLIHIRDADVMFHSKQVKVETWQLNENTDNTYRMLTHGVQPSEKNTGMAQLPSATATVKGEILDYTMVLPPSSVSLVVLTAIK